MLYVEGGWPTQFQITLIQTLINPDTPGTEAIFSILHEHNYNNTNGTYIHTNGE